MKPQDRMAVEVQRIAMGRGEKKKSKHKRNVGRTVPVSLPEWYARGLSDWSTDDILAKLKEHGLP